MRLSIASRTFCLMGFAPRPTPRLLGDDVFNVGVLVDIAQGMVNYWLSRKRRHSLLGTPFGAPFPRFDRIVRVCRGSSDPL